MGFLQRNVLLWFLHAQGVFDAILMPRISVFLYFFQNIKKLGRTINTKNVHENYFHVYNRFACRS